MQFLVLGHDGVDDGAPARRQAARPEHLAHVARLKSEGHYLYGVALLDGAERMIGSAMVLEFPGRAQLERWLKSEPYVLGKVWEKIEVTACCVAPSSQVAAAP